MILAVIYHTLAQFHVSYAPNKRKHKQWIAGPFFWFSNGPEDEARTLTAESLLLSVVLVNWNFIKGALCKTKINVVSLLIKTKLTKIGINQKC